MSLKMAKVSGAIIGLSVLLIFLLNIIQFDCEIIKDIGYETYIVDSYLPPLVNFNSPPILLRSKRETTLVMTTVATTVQPEITLVNATNVTATTTIAPVTPSQPQQRTNSRALDNISLNDNGRPLLGVNGTGQRKSITAKPINVSEPIVPDNGVINNPVPVLTTTSKLLSALKPTAAVGEYPDDHLIIDDVDQYDGETNKTLLQNNLTRFQEDYHVYYNSTTRVDEVEIDKYWKDFKNFTTSGLLSGSYRRAMTVQLSFDFPFYGHRIRNVTVATGGFLYTGEYVHSWLAATQYIAPLMANFDTSLSKDSYVKYKDNGTAFTVIWENVTLQEHPEIGNFTFSASLFDTGDIMFAYYSVPVLIESIQDDKHPVKVGLSDAYIIDKTIFFARRKTIYEYHRVNFGNEDIRNGTIIYLSALGTCVSATDCETCVINYSQLKCTWCPALNRCSSGMDRLRQDWMQKSCDIIFLTDKLTCPPLGQKGNNAADQQNQDKDVHIPNDGLWYPNSTNTLPDDVDDGTKSLSIQGTQMSGHSVDVAQPDTSDFGMAAGVMIPICFICLIAIWVFYAYRNPHTKSGQFLIQYRPSQWSWKRGEARYTAATIHM